MALRYFNPTDTNKAGPVRESRAPPICKPANDEHYMAEHTGHGVGLACRTSRSNCCPSARCRRRTDSSCSRITVSCRHIGWRRDWAGGQQQEKEAGAASVRLQRRQSNQVSALKCTGAPVAAPWMGHSAVTSTALATWQRGPASMPACPPAAHLPPHKLPRQCTQRLQPCLVLLHCLVLGRLPAGSGRSSRRIEAGHTSARQVDHKHMGCLPGHSRDAAPPPAPHAKQLCRPTYSNPQSPTPSRPPTHLASRSVKPCAGTGQRRSGLPGPPARCIASRHCSSSTLGGLTRAAGFSTTLRNRYWNLCGREEQQHVCTFVGCCLSALLRFPPAGRETQQTAEGTIINMR